MDQPSTITTACTLAVYVSKSCCAVLNDAVEFNQQQVREEEHWRITKQKHDEYDLAFLAAAVPVFSASIHRFWVDVWSGEWNTLLLNGIILQDVQFEKTFCMSQNSFAVLHDLLGIILDNCYLWHARTVHYQTRYILAPSHTISNSFILILIIRHSRVHIQPHLYAPQY